MALFGRKADARRAQTLRGWVGQLDVNLWDEDPSHELYVDRALELLREDAEASLRNKVRQPVPGRGGAVIAQIIRLDVIEGSDYPPIVDAATTGFLLSWAEEWCEFDVAALRSAIELGSRDLKNRRESIGAYITGVLTQFLEPSVLPEWKSAYDLLSSQPSYQRLDLVQQEVAAESFEAFGLGAFFTTEEMRERYRRSHRQAWLLGTAVWSVEAHLEWP